MSDTPDPSDAERLLAQADAIHDDEPERALALLRGLDPAGLPIARLARFAFLANHVFGEKFAQWALAFETLRRLVALAGTDVTPTLLRHAAIGAQSAGDAAQARAWTSALAEAADAPLAHAQTLVTLGMIGFVVPGEDAENAGRLCLLALQPVAALHARPPTALDRDFAVLTNNLASHLLDRPLDDLAQPDLRTALTLASEHSQRFWRRAGQWVNDERACYLRALAANALGEAAEAARQARAGLAILDEHDTAHAEDVDRAFIELELAQALRATQVDESRAALARAETLAARFEDASLTRRFADRRARNAALAEHDANG
jgi:hypothetical protein